MPETAQKGQGDKTVEDKYVSVFVSIVSGSVIKRLGVFSDDLLDVLNLYRIVVLWLVDEVRHGEIIQTLGNNCMGGLVDGYSWFGTIKLV